MPSGSSYQLELERPTGEPLFRRRYTSVAPARASISSDLLKALTRFAIFQEEDGKTRDFDSMTTLSLEWYKPDEFCDIGPFNNQVVAALADYDPAILQQVSELVFVHQSHWDCSTGELFYKLGLVWKRVGPTVIARQERTEHGRLRLTKRRAEDAIVAFNNNPENVKYLKHSLMTLHMIATPLEIAKLASGGGQAKFTCTNQWWDNGREELRRLVDLKPFQVKVPLAPVSFMFLAGEIRWSDKPVDGDTKYAKSILVASQNVRDALIQCSRWWTRRDKRLSLLIWAPPGSGKEVLKDAIARVLLEREDTGSPKNEVSIAAAGMGQQSFANALREEIEKLRQPSIGGSQWPDKALLFIDEIDKAEEETRSWLLRVLEAGQLPGDAAKLPEGWRFLFAGSIGPRRALKKAPKDFWTRMSAVIDMKHPFDVPQAEHQSEVIKQYLDLFSWDGVEKEWGELSGRGWAPETLALVRHLALDFFNRAAARAVSGPLAARVSVRLLRSTTGSLAPMLFQEIRGRLPELSPAIKEVNELLQDPIRRAELREAAARPDEERDDTVTHLWRDLWAMAKIDYTILSQLLRAVRAIDRLAHREFVAVLRNLLKTGELAEEQ